MEVAIARRSVAHPYQGRYVLSPVRDPRPATGRTASLVECEHCGQAVRCQIYSAEATHRLRARWRLVARLSVVTVVAMLVADAITIAGHLPDKPASPPVATLLALSSAAVAGGVLLSIRARRLARQDDGVRLPGWFGPHRLRRTSIMPND
jgi:hypothetical protein